MKISQYDFNQSLNKNLLFENKPKVAVATSGGPDSMALVFLVNKWIKTIKGSMVSLIVDHQVRSESSYEANTVHKYLLKNQIECKILKVNKNKVNKKNMNEARNNRFNKLITYCKNKGLLNLFLAHHLDDNLETFLLRKISGSNFEGLRSIQNIIYAKNLRIIRPLLNFEKKHIIEYNKKKNIFFVNDPSNYNPKYSRSIIRNFLSNNKSHKNQIKKDFEEIKKFFPFYKKMIFKILHELTLKISKKSITIKSTNFFNYDNEIQIKIIEMIYKFLYPKKNFLRSRKIIVFLKKLEINNDSKINLAGMNAKKDDFLIIFGD